MWDDKQSRHPCESNTDTDTDSDSRHSAADFDNHVFHGYTFQPRWAKNRKGKFFVGFLPAISNKAAKAIRANSAYVELPVTARLSAAPGGGQASGRENFRDGSYSPALSDFGKVPPAPSFLQVDAAYFDSRPGRLPCLRAGRDIPRPFSSHPEVKR
jgi:hypothetical protein